MNSDFDAERSFKHFMVIGHADVGKISLCEALSYCSNCMQHPIILAEPKHIIAEPHVERAAFIVQEMSMGHLPFAQTALIDEIKANVSEILMKEIEKEKIIVFDSLPLHPKENFDLSDYLAFPKEETQRRKGYPNNDPHIPNWIKKKARR